MKIKRAVILISFALCAGLSATLALAAVWGWITGEYVGLQTYAALAVTVMGCFMWGSMLRRGKAE